MSGECKRERKRKLNHQFTSCSKCSSVMGLTKSAPDTGLSDANDSSAKLTGSWWGYYLHSSVPSVAAVYATLRRQSARSRCRSLMSSCTHARIQTHVCHTDSLKYPVHPQRSSMYPLKSSKYLCVLYLLSFACFRLHLLTYTHTPTQKNCACGSLSEKS